MSLINKVLRDLDARHANAEAGDKSPEIRIPTAIQISEDKSWHFWLPKIFSFGFAILAAIAIGAGWWWLTEPVKTPAALQPLPPPLPVPPAPALPPAREAVVSRPTSPVLTKKPPKATPPAKSGDLKLAFIISAETSKKLAKELPRPEEQPITHPISSSPSSSTSAITARPVSSRERADNEYRNGYALMQQGHASEAAVRFQTALSADITHISARDGLLLILMEGKRYAEAKAILQAGIALQPVHLPWVISLARLHIEQSNAAGAWVLLQAHTKAGETSADFQGISGVVLQKLGRMKEAGEYYQAATRLAPSNPNWWVGLGLALEAEGRMDAATAAFQAANNLPGDLPPGLAEFVNQRLKSP